MHRLFRIQQVFHLHTFLSLLYDWLIALGLSFCRTPKKSTNKNSDNTSNKCISSINVKYRDGESRPSRSPRCEGTRHLNLTAQLAWQQCKCHSWPRATTYALQYRVRGETGLLPQTGCGRYPNKVLRRKEQQKASLELTLWCARCRASCYLLLNHPGFHWGWCMQMVPRGKKRAILWGATTNLSCFGSDTLRLWLTMGKIWCLNTPKNQSLPVELCIIFQVWKVVKLFIYQENGKQSKFIDRIHPISNC